MKKSHRLAALLAAFISPALVFAQNQDLTSVAGTILDLINNVLVPVLFSIAFIVFLYGVFAKYILSNGDQDKVAEGHKLILWGLIGFAVMISIWGLVNVVANTFGLNYGAGSVAPNLPQTPLSPGAATGP